MRRAILTLLLVVAAVHVAAADVREDAKHEFAAGQADDKKGDYASAIEHYLRAYDYVPHPFALYNVAVDYEQLGKLREAVHYYQTYVESPDASDKDRVRAKITDLRTKPAKLEVQADADGATVTVDGQSFGTTPYSGRIKGGVHVVVVEKDDKRDEKRVTVEFGEPVSLTFAVGGRPGTLIVQGTPIGAQVAIDGARVGTMPLSQTVPAGEHKVAVAQVGFQTYEATVDVAPNGPTYLRPNLIRGLDGSGGTSPTQIKAMYELGMGAGADVRGHGAAYQFELGLRALNYEVAVTIGKVIDETSVELQIRYAFTRGWFSPVLGVGYSYIGNKAAAETSGDTGASSSLGYEIFGGLRADLYSGDSVGISMLGMMAARYRATTDTFDDNTMMNVPGGVTGIFPVTFTLQLYYRLNK